MTIEIFVFWNCVQFSLKRISNPYNKSPILNWKNIPHWEKSH